MSLIGQISLEWLESEEPQGGAHAHQRHESEQYSDGGEAGSATDH